MPASEPASLEELAKTHLKTVRKLALVTGQLRLARDPILSERMQAAYETRVALEESWAAHLLQLSQSLVARLNLDSAIRHAQNGWVVPEPGSKGLWSKLQKEDGQANDPLPPSVQEVMAALAAGFDEEVWQQGAAQVYIGLALRTGQASGQYALDTLGINRTFAWAHPQAMANDLFAVRGSKIIQNMYGDHLAQLSDLIIGATDPRNPLTIDQVKQLIQERWPDLQKYQIDRIARTETASVWTSTSANAYAANGISQYESIIAHGPSIGIESEDPCEECIDAAAEGPFDLSGDLPPWHPNCRCEAIPVLEDEDGEPWLPPQEPWAGEGELPEEAAPTPMPESDPEAEIEASRETYAEKLDAVRKRLRIVG